MLEEGQPFAVVVDYAHTPDALANVLDAARELGPGALRVVFGAGGERDLRKRPRMGAAATEHADDVIVTTDNPRSEDPEAIIGAVIAGCSRPVTVVVDRRDAIAEALARSVAGDVVVIAGKGHEATQTVDGRELPFDDRAVARAILADRTTDDDGGAS
jgi:UDP-N-acetylmuramoyl-L-alanyl-D-glutamate--2,6-diaminopimelate ligase